MSRPQSAASPSLKGALQMDRSVGAWQSWERWARTRTEDAYDDADKEPVMSPRATGCQGPMAAQQARGWGAHHTLPWPLCGTEKNDVGSLGHPECGTSLRQPKGPTQWGHSEHPSLESECH